MWDFIKKIFSERDGDVTVVVLDDNDPNGSSSFKVVPADIIKLALVVMGVSVFITILIFFATPVGSLYQHQKDENLRQDILMISERLVALQDSLIARDLQLNNMKEVLRLAPDTLFQVQYMPGLAQTEETRSGERDFNAVYAFDMLSQNEIIFSGNLNRSPDFPAAFPLTGTLTQHYSPAQNHYGIDIAARPGTEFRALADGTIVNAGWTISYGYVIYVQHADGIMSVYKHGSKLLKEKGGFVLKGDILGRIGDTGVLSSGSHLHLEIWKNGVSQNPIMYLIN